MSSVAPFGCIVDYSPGKSGLVHVSELDTARTADPATSWKAGDKIDVKVLEYDKASGRTKLSRFATYHSCSWCLCSATENATTCMLHIYIARCTVIIILLLTV